MMTTGYDCQDILNLCLMRPIFSPTDFVQIKGRGTRNYSFAYKQRNEMGQLEESKAPKQNYKMFDFFAVCEYFEEKYNYDQILKLPQVGTVDGEGGWGGINVDEFISEIRDPLKSIAETVVGFEGMRVDRELFGNFAETVQKDEFVAKKVEEGDFDSAEEYIREHIFDKPEEFFNLMKLRKSVNVDRRLTLREILEMIFGFIPKFKSKDELLDEEFEKFISVHKPEPEYAIAIKNFLKAYITDAEVQDIIKTKEYARFATNPIRDDFEALKPELREIIPEYVKDYVQLNTYM